MLLHKDQEAAIDYAVRRIAAKPGATFVTKWEFGGAFLNLRPDLSYDIGIRISFNAGEDVNSIYSRIDVEKIIGRVTSKIPNAEAALNSYLISKRDLLIGQSFLLYLRLVAYLIGKSTAAGVDTAWERICKDLGQSTNISLNASRGHEDCEIYPHSEFDYLLPYSIKG